MKPGKQRAFLETFQELGWQKWPIVVFAIISFFTTAYGIVALVPSGVPVSVAWLFSLPFSYAVQWTMLGSALEIAREGVRWRWMAFYLLAAVFSVGFSYVAMYKLLVEDAFEAQDAEQQAQLFSDFQQNTLTDLEKAFTALDIAIAEVESWTETEGWIGRTGSAKRVSPYLQKTLDETGFDTSADQFAGGKGPVYARWLAVHKVLTSRRQRIDEWRKLEALTKEPEKGADLQSKARSIEASFDRGLVNKVLNGEGYDPLVEGVPAGLKGQFERPDDRRVGELILVAKAWNDLKERSSDPLIGAAAFAALFFDAVALLLAMTSVRTASEAVVRERIEELLVELAALNSSAPKAAFLLSQRIHSCGRLVDRWFLDLEDIKAMGQLERLIVSRLEGLGLMKTQRLRRRMAVASAARRVLRQTGISQAVAHPPSGV